MMIRSAEKGDTRGMLSIYGPFIENTTVSFELEVPSEEEFHQRVLKVQETGPWLVCDVAGEVAGYTYGSEHRARKAYRFTREVSVYVNEKFRGQGIGRKLYLALFALLRCQGYATALAGATLPNDPSVAFHKSMGFTPVGVYHRTGYKFGKFLDVAWFELVLNEEIPGEVKLPGDFSKGDWEQIINDSINK